MPGFWETMKRLVAGQPVYRAEEEDGTHRKSEEQPEQASIVSKQPSSTAPPPPPQGPKVVPLAMIESTECRLHAPNMEVTVQVQNNALEDLMMDKVVMLGRTFEIDRTMRPGEEHEFIVFNGPMPNNTNYSRCELHYRNLSGDYFSAIHNIEYDLEEDGLYSVRRIRFIPPVKDI